MMEYEIKMTEIRKKNVEKLNLQKEREYEREKEIVKTRKQVDINIFIKNIEYFQFSKKNSKDNRT